jgi:hypothetical protein
MRQLPPAQEFIVIEPKGVLARGCAPPVVFDSGLQPVHNGSLHPARRGDLALHPTTKPLALIADLIRDCSRRNGVILDPFGGSGTTVLASERTGRVARSIELDPLYVDVAIRRWEKITDLPARHATSGLSFGQVAAERGVINGPNDPSE